MPVTTDILPTVAVLQKKNFKWNSTPTNKVGKHKTNPTNYFCKPGDIPASLLEKSVIRMQSGAPR